MHVGGGVAVSVDDGALRTDDARVVLSEVSEVKSRQDNMTVKLENLKLYVTLVICMYRVVQNFTSLNQQTQPDNLSINDRNS